MLPCSTLLRECGRISFCNRVLLAALMRCAGNILSCHFFFSVLCRPAGWFVSTSLNLSERGLSYCRCCLYIYTYCCISVSNWWPVLGHIYWVLKCCGLCPLLKCWGLCPFLMCWGLCPFLNWWGLCPILNCLFALSRAVAFHISDLVEIHLNTLLLRLVSMYLSDQRKIFEIILV